MAAQYYFYYCDTCECSLENADCVFHCTDPACNTSPQEGYQLCHGCYTQGRTSKSHQAWHVCESGPLRPHVYLYATQSASITRVNSISSLNSQSSANSQSTYESSSSDDFQTTYHHQPPYNSQPLFRDAYEPMIIGGNASPTFSRLAKAIFYDVDNADPNIVRGRFPRGTKQLEPEKCSLIMSLLGFFHEHNIFQRLFDEGQANGRGVAWSDAQIAHMYQHHRWDFRLATRAGTIYDMPVLTECGLLQMLMCEASVDPANFSARVNGLLHKVGGLEDDLTGQNFYIGNDRWPSMPDEGMVRFRNEILMIVEATIQEGRGFLTFGGYQQNRSVLQQGKDTRKFSSAVPSFFQQQLMRVKGRYM